MVAVEIVPEIALVDDPLTVRVTGLDAGTPVTLLVGTRDHSGRQWSTQERGVVGSDGAFAAPDPARLLWSMRPIGDGEGDDAQPSPFALFSTDEIVVTFAAVVDRDVVAAADATRRLVGPGVQRETAPRPLVGTFFLPTGPGPHPAVLDLFGSGGGLVEARAALLASRGYATLALSYFGSDGLPPDPVEVPLEYVEAALEWLVARPDVAGGRAAVVGTSKGGELALLVGASFPHLVRAVVGYVPSGASFFGVRRDGSATEQSSWAYKGHPVPFVPVPGDSFDRLRARTGVVSTTPLYLEAVRDPEVRAEATIPVERIDGPVLLISGGDDGMWPSNTLAGLARDRLAVERHPHEVKHLRYLGAGHLIRMPILPTTVHETFHPGLGKAMALGGRDDADARAAADSWAQVLAFLHRSLRGGVPSRAG